MADIEETLNLIREVHGELGSPALAKLAGLPYMTMYEAAKRDFGGRSVDTLRKLEAAAKTHRAKFAPGVE